MNTNESIPEISTLNILIKDERVAVIGVGGTGSYLLDLLSKTEAKEIHIFDDDVFLNNNAFRSPGAASVEQLINPIKKVSYFHKIYSNMHNGVIPHDCKIFKDNLDELKEMTYVFIAIDKSEYKKPIVDFLVENNIPFTDVGLSVRIENDKLAGAVRTTSFHLGNTDHLYTKIPFADAKDDEYNTNVQIAELNMLNAVLAIMKWKKYIGYYADRNEEQFTNYIIAKNKILNEDIKA